jgi:hypothetical protein
MECVFDHVTQNGYPSAGFVAMLVHQALLAPNLKAKHADAAGR